MFICNSCETVLSFLAQITLVMSGSSNGLGNVHLGN